MASGLRPKFKARHAKVLRRLTAVVECDRAVADRLRAHRRLPVGVAGARVVVVAGVGAEADGAKPTFVRHCFNRPRIVLLFSFFKLLRNKSAYVKSTG